MYIKCIFYDLVEQKGKSLFSMNEEKWLWHRRLGHEN